MDSEIFRSHNLDLARRRSELESIFDLVIKKIPDLCMPPVYRWAGERDFFNETTNIKLVPLHKQRIVERCLTPEPKPMKPASPSLTSIRDSPRRETPLSIGSNSPHTSKVTFGEGCKSWQASSSTCASKKQSASSVHSSEAKMSEKYANRQRLHRHYSRIKPKRKSGQQNEEQYRLGFDRLFMKRPAESYPFANPIPACMLAEENYDNLREIIVSSGQIEWKMLTPIRPSSDYEEGYFDKLVQLHRHRYRCRYELGLYSSEHMRSPFRHTRHSYLIQQHPLRSHDDSSRSPITLGVKLKHKFSPRNERLKSTGRLNVKLTIPTLTLTSDESGSELIEGFSASQGEELVDLSYENFSRYSKRNSLGSIRANKSGQAELFDSSSDPFAMMVGRQSQTGGSQARQTLVPGDQLDEQVESIISYLMSSNL